MLQKIDVIRLLGFGPIAVYDLGGRVTGRDIIARLAAPNPSGRDPCLSNLAIVQQEVRDTLKGHPHFANDGGPNLFLAGGLNALSIIRTRVGGYESERVGLHGRVPWRGGRLFVWDEQALAA